MAQPRSHCVQGYIRSRRLIEPENARDQARENYRPQTLGHREIQRPKVEDLPSSPDMGSGDPTSVRIQVRSRVPRIQVLVAKSALTKADE